MTEKIRESKASKYEKRQLFMNREDSILITNIQRFSLHDGPGIRTTVFLKGCSLYCPWCSNPENISAELQSYEKEGEKGTYGKYCTSEELIKECLKDRVFYEGELGPDQWNIRKVEQITDVPGGVTFSGGEPLLQIQALVPVISALHEEGVHVAAETCLFIPTCMLESALEQIDLFYCDVKILNKAKCREIEGGDMDLYLKNLDALMTWRDENGRGKPVVIRVPAIGSYTDTDDNRAAVKQLIYKYRKNALKIEIIKEHNLGEGKYKSLGRKSEYHGVEDSLMEKYRNELEELGVPVEVCRL